MKIGHKSFADVENRPQSFANVSFRRLSPLFQPVYNLVFCPHDGLCGTELQELPIPTHHDGKLQTLQHTPNKNLLV